MRKIRQIGEKDTELQTKIFKNEEIYYITVEAKCNIWLNLYRMIEWLSKRAQLYSSDFN